MTKKAVTKKTGTRKLQYPAYVPKWFDDDFEKFLKSLPKNKAQQLGDYVKEKVDDAYNAGNSRGYRAGHFHGNTR